jgi:hypothetical protein
MSPLSSFIYLAVWSCQRRRPNITWAHVTWGYECVPARPYCFIKLHRHYAREDDETSARLSILPTAATPTLTENICSIFCNLGFCRLYCNEVVLSSPPLTIGMSAGPTWSEECPIPLPVRFGDLRDAKKKPICVTLYSIVRGIIGLCDFTVET